MILIDAPYYNEYVPALGVLSIDLMIIHRPGHGQANPKAQVSINYNREICLQTCRWAITEWLKDKYKAGIWKASRRVLFSYIVTEKISIRTSSLHILPFEKTRYARSESRTLFLFG
jgi:hypothetical protein